MPSFRSIGTEFFTAASLAAGFLFGQLNASTVGGTGRAHLPGLEQLAQALAGVISIELLVPRPLDFNLKIAGVMP